MRIALAVTIIVAATLAGCMGPPPPPGGPLGPGPEGAPSGASSDGGTTGSTSDATQSGPTGSTGGSSGSTSGSTDGSADHSTEADGPTHYGEDSLVLGDQAFQSWPQVGKIYACESSYNGGGAFQDGDWIHDDGTWSPSEKDVTVSGSVDWDSMFDASVSGDDRVLTGNALPDHPTGTYPVAASDDAYDYDRNPNQIQAQTVDISIPADPQIADSPMCLSLGAIGIMLSGSYFFNGLDGEGRDAAAHEIQDDCNGHPEMDGTYHYHNLSPCIDDGSTGHSQMIGYALDGFGLYGSRGEDGSILHDEDLDACHGHNHSVSWQGGTIDIYHYHTTPEFPYTLGCFMGTPTATTVGQPSGDPSGGGSGGAPPEGGDSPPPQGGDGNPPPPQDGGGGNPPPPPP